MLDAHCYVGFVVDQGTVQTLHTVRCSARFTRRYIDLTHPPSKHATVADGEEHFFQSV